MRSKEINNINEEINKINRRYNIQIADGKELLGKVLNQWANARHKVESYEKLGEVNVVA